MHHPAISTLRRAPRIACRAPGSMPRRRSARRARCPPAAADPPRPTGARRPAACAARSARACPAGGHGERSSSARSRFPQRGRPLGGRSLAWRGNGTPPRRRTTGCDQTGADTRGQAIGGKDVAEASRHSGESRCRRMPKLRSKSATLNELDALPASCAGAASERRPARTPSRRDVRCSRHTRPARRVSIRAAVGELGAPGRGRGLASRIWPCWTARWGAWSCVRCSLRWRSRRRWLRWTCSQSSSVSGWPREEVGFLIADSSGNAVVRLSHDGGGEGRRSQGGDAAETVPLAGTPYEQVVRTQRLQVLPAGEFARVLAPVTDRGDVIGRAGDAAARGP